MNEKDPFVILGLYRSAHPTKEEIKKQYLVMAKQWHPDVNKSKGAPERFKQIQDAYSYLQNNTSAGVGFSSSSSSSSYPGSASGYSYSSERNGYQSYQSYQNRQNYQGDFYYTGGPSGTASGSQWARQSTNQSLRGGAWKKILLILVVLPIGFATVFSPAIPDSIHRGQANSSLSLSSSLSSSLNRQIQGSKAYPEVVPSSLPQSSRKIVASGTVKDKDASSTTATAGSIIAAASIPAGASAGVLPSTIPDPPATSSSSHVVDAWFNVSSGFWETPAPWSDDYKEYLTNHSLRKVDRKIVRNSKR